MKALEKKTEFKKNWVKLTKKEIEKLNTELRVPAGSGALIINRINPRLRDERKIHLLGDYLDKPRTIEEIRDNFLDTANRAQVVAIDPELKDVYNPGDVVHLREKVNSAGIVINGTMVFRIYAQDVTIIEQ